MHSLVRDAYKRLIWAGRVYPKGLDYVRDKAKKGFREHQIADHTELVHAVQKARWWAKELEGVAALAKYRALRQRYGGSAPPTLEAEQARLEKAFSKDI